MTTGRPTSTRSLTSTRIRRRRPSTRCRWSCSTDPPSVWTSRTCLRQTDITAEHLEAAERAAGVTVEPGDILLLHTGTFGRYAGTPEYLTEFPGLGESGSKWIAHRGVKTFGVDSPTPDNPVSKIYPCHLMCRHSGITHYENLANLDQLIGKRFTFAGFPLKLIGGHGGPTRAVALLDTDA